MLKNKLQPDLVLGEPVLGVTLELIERYNLQGLVLDVDETLVPLREAETTAEVQIGRASCRERV